MTAETRRASIESLRPPRSVRACAHISVSARCQGHLIEELGEYKSNRRTNAFNKTDARACTIAFLSAVISLQTRAREVGADAVVEVKSITKNRELESATHYRCVAGNVVANVTLTGKMVRFED